MALALDTPNLVKYLSYLSYLPYLSLFFLSHRTKYQFILTLLYCMQSVMPTDDTENMY